MQKPDLIGAFRIAAERGVSVEQVKISLLNAGYPQQDVDDSAQAYSQGFRPMPMLQPMGAPQQKMPPQVKPLPTLTGAPGKPMPSTSILEEKKKMPGYLIGAIVFTAVVVVGAIGFVIFTLVGG